MIFNSLMHMHSADSLINRWTLCIHSYCILALYRDMNIDLEEDEEAIIERRRQQRKLIEQKYQYVSQCICILIDCMYVYMYLL